MREFEKHVGKSVEVELSGHIVHGGRLMDCGQDVLVIYDGSKYLYIPSPHVQHIKEDTEMSYPIDKKSMAPIEDDSNTISYRKILSNAKGGFAEIYVTGEQTLHGYITNVMNDYFTFYSPVYKTMLVSLDHMKWLTPYQNGRTPYDLNNNQFPVTPSNISLSRTMEEQLKKFVGKLVVFDAAERPEKIGLLSQIEGKLVELITAREEKVYLNLKHLKTVHLPWLD